ncbi:hypothetical protein [Butyrivibrio sp. M55]|uniref:hypothetical protein n=1 Tax=Butyrivibrio sp. M55 TaxID=1855323 RepID=UPI0008E501A2|nr:hypothetical protein [Butyrivibrio sp. M55]SFU33620.1 hypothetical protein SAMN05216540_101144 [Butyrivibrio sp. M55]
MSLLISSSLYDPYIQNNNDGALKKETVKCCNRATSIGDVDEHSQSSLNTGEKLGVTSFGDKMYVATYADCSTEEEPVVKVGQYEVRINDVNPNNATKLELFALMSYLDKNGALNNRGISSYSKIKAFSYQAEANGYCSGLDDIEKIFSQKRDWISILNNAKETFLGNSETYHQALEIDKMIFSLSCKW